METNKDWTGDSNSVFKTLGASSHSNVNRQAEDYYATDPMAVKLLLKIEEFSGPVWEPACGGGHMSEVLINAGMKVRSTDLFDRGYGEHGIDFLSIDNTKWNGDIITNPPYRYATEFVYKSLQIIPDGFKVAMFLKVQFLEGKQRKQLFVNHPPKVVHVSSSRLLCAKDGVFNKQVGVISSSAVAYAWFVWVKGYRGETSLRWFN